MVPPDGGEPPLVHAALQDRPQRSAAGTPVGRIGQPGDVADAVPYLAGNRFVTGTVLDVSGGLTLARG